MSTSISPRHQAALDYAADGIPIFPCLPGTKRPATTNGQHDATTNVAQINAWWAEADYNVAFCPASQGWCIVDLDGEDGMAQWKELQHEHGRVESYTVRTPGAGLHVYLQGDLPSSQHRLGPRIDTRGQGATGKWTYALIPPSIIDGKEYEIAVDIDVAPVPIWLPALVTTREQPKATTSEHTLDTETALARAIVYLGGLPAVREGEGSDALAFSACAMLHDLGISEGKCLDLMLEHFKCEPLDTEWLEEKVANAYRYAQNDPGVWAVEPAAKVFANLSVSEIREKRGTKFRLRSRAEQLAQPDPQWIVKDLLMDGGAALLYGDTGSLKTYMAADIACAIATGLPCFAGTPVRQGPVIYVPTEGRAMLEKGRITAWEIAHELPQGSIPFYTVPAPSLLGPDDIAQWIEDLDIELEHWCPGQRVGLIVLDTMAKVMVGMDGNGIREAGEFNAFAEGIALHYGCTSLSVGHVNKAGEVMGSNAFRQGLDTVLLAQRAPDKANGASVRVMKQRDAPERDEPWYLEGVMVPQVGNMVLRPVSGGQWRVLTGKGDVTSRGAVGAALAAIPAVGPENAVTTMALAAQLLRDKSDYDMGDLNRLVKALRKAAREGHLAGYTPIGQVEPWYLPTG